MDVFGIVGGVFQVLQSLFGVIVGLISTEVFLSSVFRRLYFTSKMDDSNNFRQNSIIFRRESTKPQEELKTPKEFIDYSMSMNSKLDESRHSSDINVRIQSRQNSFNFAEEENNFLPNKLKSILSRRRKYHALGCHKFLTLIPQCLLKNSELKRK